MTAIGIDPGTYTGYAVWDCEWQEFITLETLDFWDCYFTVLARSKMDERVIVRCEDPAQNNPVWHGKGQKMSIRMNIAQKVGGNKREAELMIKGLRAEGILVQTVRPAESKLNAETFRRITGYQGRTNSHKRDAGRLVLGLTPMPDKTYNRLLKQQEAA